jgi:hypothetical protein
MNNNFADSNYIRPRQHLLSVLPELLFAISFGAIATAGHIHTHEIACFFLFLVIFAVLILTIHAHTPSIFPSGNFFFNSLATIVKVISGHSPSAVRILSTLTTPGIGSPSINKDIYFPLEQSIVTFGNILTPHTNVATNKIPYHNVALFFISPLKNFHPE